MTLLQLRQTNKQSAEYVIPFYQERGGILSLASLSGVSYAIYEMNPGSTTVPLGIQQFDTTEVDLFRAIPPWRSRNEYPPFIRQPYIIAGEVITNAIDSTVTTININQPAFLAPSGLLTNSTKYGTKQIGRFLSVLNSRLLGTISFPSRIRIAGDDSIVNPNSVFAHTAGWAKLLVQL